MGRSRIAVPLLAAVALGAGLMGAPAPAQAASSKPVAVSLGDSFIVGEAGRWAGNVRGLPSRVDALGSTAYYDNAAHTAELIPGCHRALRSPIHFSSGVKPVNLACSGAAVASGWEGKKFKPGIDFYNDGKGHQGQAAMLRSVAAGSNVRMIVVSIGGNDLGFGDILRTCVVDYSLTRLLTANYCKDDTGVTRRLTSASVARVRTGIITALRNVRTAMRQAGYSDSSYTVVVQTYPSVLAPSTLLRYPQAGPKRTTTGACPFWNADANWADETLLPLVNSTVRSAAAASGLARVQVLDLSGALEGHRLCEQGVGQLQETGLASWKDPGAVDKSEWVEAVRSVTGVVGPYSVREDLHPDYWGQRAMAACLMLAWNHGSPRGGSCTPGGSGLVGNAPPMVLN